MANAPALASLQYKVWEQGDGHFRLGYVIGYLDAVALQQRKDAKVQVPVGNSKNVDHWLQGIAEFYADPANQGRSVPDAIYAVGSKARDEMLRNWGLQRMGKPTPMPSVQP